MPKNQDGFEATACVPLDKLNSLALLVSPVADSSTSVKCKDLFFYEDFDPGETAKSIPYAIEK